MVLVVAHDAGQAYGPSGEVPIAAGCTCSESSLPRLATCRGTRACVRLALSRVADSVYIIHRFVVLAAQFVILGVGAPVLLKFALVTVAAVLTSFG